MQSAKSISLAALAVVMVGGAVAGFSVPSASAKGSDGVRSQSARTITNIHVALRKEDYETWRELTEGLPIQNFIDDEDDFHRLVSAHRALTAGELAEAKEVFDELGLVRPFEGAHRHPHGVGVRLLLELNDEEFALLSRAQLHFQEGETETAHELLETVRARYQARL